MVTTLLVVVICLIVIGIPIAISLGLGSLLVLKLYGGYPLALIAQKMFSISDHYTLLAIPLFILAGFLMDIGGLSERMVRAVSALIGFIRGGLALVAVITCMLFAGVSGSAVADAAAVGAVILRPMKAKGYDPGFSASLVGAAGTIGPIIPPSIPFIIFGVATGTSIADLFLGGAIPGLLIGASLMIVAYVVSARRGYPAEPAQPWRQMARDVLGGIPAIFMMVIILGGILGGVFTATEAAVAAVLYAFAVGIFVYRSLTLDNIYVAIRKTVDATAVVLWLIATASLLSWILTSEQIPDAVAAYLSDLTSDPVALLALMAVLYLVVGMLIDVAPAILMLVPVLFPVAQTLGIDPVHFGVVTVTGLAIGLITPPTAPTLMVTASIAEVSAGRAFRSVFPFVVAMTIVLFLVVFFPGLALWLPQMAR